MNNSLFIELTKIYYIKDKKYSEDKKWLKLLILEVLMKLSKKNLTFLTKNLMKFLKMILLMLSIMVNQGCNLKDKGFKVSDKAEERAYAADNAIISGYLYPTTFERETYSDLTGECGTLLGCIQDYHENLSKELKELRESKVWQTAAIIRSLRLEKQKVHNRYF
ncbi:hypothetical protein U3516DRAFT_659497 [Neocallimastix sp. 'constans']